MSFTTTTPNMSLVLPIPTQELGPAWAVELNAALTQVDSHNHTAGQGVPIPSAALNINADLSFQGNNLTNLNSERYNDVGTPLSSPADLRSIYVSGGNLYYNNQLGQQVQITAGASLNAASIGGIGGDYVTSGAAVYYTAVSSSYSFTSFGNLYSNMFNGAMTIFETGTNIRGVTIQSPSGLAAAYSLTLPPGLPAADAFAVISASGQISVTIPVSLGINTANIAAGAITAAKMAANSVTTTTIVDANVTRAKLAAVGQQLSAGAATQTTSSPTYIGLTGLSVNITVSGTRPVIIMIVPDGTSNDALCTASASETAQFRLTRNATTIAQWRMQNQSGSATLNLMPMGAFLDATPVGGVNTYAILGQAPGSTAIGFNHCKLVAYELA